MEFDADRASLVPPPVKIMSDDKMKSESAPKVEEFNDLDALLADLQGSQIQANNHKVDLSKTHIT